MILLDLEDLLHVAERTLVDVVVRDLGLLDAAASRPNASAFGEPVYPSIHHKTAALLHSLARTQALVDGNKRLALASAIAFYGLNGLRLTVDTDEAYELVVHVAEGVIDDVEVLAAVLADRTAPRSTH